MYSSSRPFVVDQIRAVVVTCSDGHWGSQIDDFIETHLALPRFDLLAIPGGAGCLAGRPEDWKEVAAFEEELALLVEVHKLRRAVLIAHQDCAFYSVHLNVPPAEIETHQRRDLVAATERIQSLHAGVATECWYAHRDGGPTVKFDRWDGA